MANQAYTYSSYFFLSLFYGKCSTESAGLQAATKRMNGLMAIDPSGKLDLGNGHTIAAYQEAMDKLKTNLDSYNKARKELDALKNQLDTVEKNLKQQSSFMLAAVSLKYGKDSSEYEQCGGVRASERKKPVRKAKGTLGAS